MPSEDDRYRAYQLLRKLESLTSLTMSQVAYGNFEQLAWNEMCESHREVFEDWMRFAQDLSSQS